MAATRPRDRKLILRRETLRVLTDEEQERVGGMGSKYVGGKYYPCDTKGPDPQSC